LKFPEEQPVHRERHGAGRPSEIYRALVVPNCKMISAKAAEKNASPFPLAKKLPRILSPERDSIGNARLTANLAQYETIKRFALLPGRDRITKGDEDALARSKVLAARCFFL